MLLHASGPQQAHPILDRAFRHTPSLPLTGPSLSNCIRRNEQLLFDTPFLPLSTYLAALIYYRVLRHLQKLIYPLCNDILNLIRVIFLIENLVTRFLSRCTFG